MIFTFWILIFKSIYFSVCIVFHPLSFLFHPIYAWLTLPFLIIFIFWLISRLFNILFRVFILSIYFLITFCLSYCILWFIFIAPKEFEAFSSRIILCFLFKIISKIIVCLFTVCGFILMPIFIFDMTLSLFLLSSHKIIFGIQIALQKIILFLGSFSSLFDLVIEWYLSFAEHWIAILNCYLLLNLYSQLNYFELHYHSPC